MTAAQAKLKTGRLAVRAAEEAVQIHGGYGYIEEYPVCRFYRDAKILTIGEGTDEVQQMVIARGLGALVRVGTWPNNENVAAIESAVEQMNSGNLEGYLEMYADDLTLHGYPPEVQGKEGVSAFYAAFAKALPDIELTLEDAIAEGDKVAVRFTVKGTHSDELMGVPATGNQRRRERAVVLQVRERPSRRALAVARRGDAADAARRPAGAGLSS